MLHTKLEYMNQLTIEEWTADTWAQHLFTPFEVMGQARSEVGIFSLKFANIFAAYIYIFDLV